MPGRRAIPPSRPKPHIGVIDPFAGRSDYGDCECETCDRAARAHCSRCGGDYCLSHTAHPGHRTAAAASS